MADEYRDALLHLGDDYTLDRYAFRSETNPDELERGANGLVIWHHGEPDLEDWGRVGMVTIDYDPGGEGKPRNIPISPDEPLDPLGRPDLSDDPDYFYDLDDLASQFDWSQFSP